VAQPSTLQRPASKLRSTGVRCISQHPVRCTDCALGEITLQPLMHLRFGGAPTLKKEHQAELPPTPLSSSRSKHNLEPTHPTHQTNTSRLHTVPRAARCDIWVTSGALKPLGKLGRSSRCRGGTGSQLHYTPNLPVSACAVGRRLKRSGPLFSRLQVHVPLDWSPVLHSTRWNLEEQPQPQEH